MSTDQVCKYDVTNETLYRECVTIPVPVEAGIWKLEVVKFLWKRKHFDFRSRKHFLYTWGRDVKAEALWRSWKRKQTRKQLTLYGVWSGSKKYSTSLFCKIFIVNLAIQKTQIIWRFQCIEQRYSLRLNFNGLCDTITIQ